MRAFSFSTPSSAQVPVARYPQLVAGSAGTDATALAVSCEPTATSGTPSSPGTPRTVPSTVPGFTGGDSSDRATPILSSREPLQSRVSRSMRPEVDAIVASLAFSPQSA